MGKRKPRWKAVSAYDLARDSLQGKQQTPDEAVAGATALNLYRQGSRPQAKVRPDGKIVVQ